MTSHATLLPVSAVIPTRNRCGPLRRTLESLAAQSAQPAELILVDASDDTDTERFCRDHLPGLRTAVRWLRAAHRGAGVQRNEGVGHATQPFIAFMDDDILFEPECLARLWSAVRADPALGGVNAMIVNQCYLRPGPVRRALLAVLNRRRLKSYAGLCVGPAVNLLPEDRADLPEVVPVEWLNLGCTLYQRKALPSPPFDAHFTGYSLMEDLALSLVVNKRWKLANVRTARIFHDSQPGAHKSDPAALAEMELVNRHYIMTRILGRRGVMDYVRLGVWEAFVAAAAVRGGLGRASRELWGKARGALKIAAGRGG